MKRLAVAAALGVVLMAVPVCAQRGSAHGGSSAGHSAPASHGSFAPSRGSAPSRGAVSGRATGSGRSSSLRRPVGSLTMPRSGQRNASGSSLHRPPYSRAGSSRYPGQGSSRRRRPYVPAYRAGYGYGILGYGYPGWVGPGYLGYPDAGDDDEGTAQQDVSAVSGDGQDQGPGDYDQGPYPPAQPPYPQAPSAMAQAAPGATTQDAVTLIFKDGRPPEQIRNFILTGNTLYVGGRRPSEIPIDQIDLAETSRVNRYAGVDFQIPGSSR